jgi:hypothetical protein
VGDRAAPSAVRAAVVPGAGGETVNVTADPGQAAYQADLARNGSGDDGHGVVVIPSKSVVIFLTPNVRA